MDENKVSEQEQFENKVKIIRLSEEKSSKPVKKQSNFILFFLGCVILAAALFFNGIQLYQRQSLVNTPGSAGNDPMSSLVKAIEEDEDLYSFLQVYEYLKTSSTIDLDRTVIIDGAIEGMLDVLGDDYASYYKEKDFNIRMDDSSGFYSGIGASVISSGGYITIVQPYENSPAKEAGLQTGDQLLSVDGIDVAGWSTQDGIVLVRGEVGKDVVLRIRRPGVMDDFDVVVTRALVETITVTGSMLDDKIALIEISSFNDQTGKQMSALIDGFIEEGMLGLIIDLRSNGGGTHTGVVETAQAVVPAGKIFSITYANGYTASEYSFLEDRPFKVVVLVNQYSASASEVLAGALQDSGSKLVGVTTYGKGVGQSSTGLKNGSGLTFTTSNWYTRDGHWVAQKGLTPDIIIYDYSFPLGVFEQEKMTNTDISLLQAKLTALGFEVNEEGFGLQTQKALLAYQESRNLQSDALLDLAIVQSLNAECLELRADGEDVQLQAALAQMAAELK